VSKKSNNFKVGLPGKVILYCQLFFTEASKCVSYQTLDDSTTIGVEFSTHTSNLFVCVCGGRGEGGGGSAAVGCWHTGRTRQGFTDFIPVYVGGATLPMTSITVSGGYCSELDRCSLKHCSTTF
jgi:hypothetical protein